MNINSIGAWLNANQGILALYIFIASLVIAGFVGILKFLLRKPQHEGRKSSEFIHAGRDINVGRDMIGKQHVTNNVINDKSSHEN